MGVISDLIKKNLRKVGVDLIRYPDDILKRELQLLEHFKINRILDVGANTGQYAERLFGSGYKGKITSFEPVSATFAKLSLHAKKYKNWTVANMAIGDIDGEIEINISQNSVSSSIADMLPSHLEGSPQSYYVSKEKVPIHKLDTVFNNYVADGENVFLKTDTQGFEKNVLDGANGCMSKIIGMQIEMSLIPLYNSETLFRDMFMFLESKGYTLYGVDPFFANKKTGQLLQLDGLFYRG